MGCELTQQCPGRCCRMSSTSPKQRAWGKEATSLHNLLLAPVGAPCTRHSCSRPGTTQPRELQGRQQQSPLLLRLNRPKTFSGKTIKCLAVREQGIPKWDCLLFPLGISVRKDRETGCFIIFFLIQNREVIAMLKQTAQGLSGGKEGGKRKAPTEYLQKVLRSTLQSVDLWFMYLLIHFPLITGAVAITQELNRGNKQCKSCKTPRAAGLSNSFGRAAFICRHHFQISNQD